MCVEVRELAVLRDGRRAPRGTASRNLCYPCCFRDIGAVEIAMQQVRRARVARASTGGPVVPAVPGDVEQAVRAAYAASVAAGQPLGRRAMAGRFGLSRRRVGQLVAQVTASGNGHRPEGEAA